jgi:hypothetical protein
MPQALHGEYARLDDMRKLAWAASPFPDAALIADHDGIIELVNPAFDVERWRGSEGTSSVAFGRYR